MSANLNKVFLIGNLTRDPESKDVGKTVVAKFSIAVNRQYKGGDGEMKKEVEFVNIEAWGRTAENCAKYLTKGSSVHIEGRLKTDTYEKDGQKRSFVKVVAEAIQFLSKSGERHSDGGEPAPDYSDGDVPF